MRKPCKLTRTNAVKLMSRVVPVPASAVIGPTGNNGAVIFTAQLGLEGLKVKVENDWYDNNSCIKLTIHDTWGGSCLIMYFNPSTFQRDFSAEELEKRKAAAAIR